MSKKKYFIFSASKIFILQIISRAISFWVFIYLARILGVDSFGNFNYILSLCALLSLFIDFGTNQLVVKIIAEDTDSKSLLAFILINVSILKLLQFIFGLIFIVLLDSKLMVYNFSIFNFIFLYTFFEGVGQICISVLNGRRQFLKANLFLFSYEILRSFLILSSLFLIKKINYIPFIYVFCAFVYAFILLNKILNEYNLSFHLYDNKLEVIKKYFNRKNLFNYYKSSFYFFLSAIAYQLYFRVDIILMKHLSTEHELGLYSTAYKFFDVFLFIPAIISGMIFPMVVQFYTKNSILKLQSFITEIQITSCILLSFIPVFIIFFSDSIIKFFFGYSYDGSIKVLQLIFLTSYIYLYNLVYPILFNATGNEKLGLYIYAIGFGFNFILNYFFIPQYGGISAAIITLLSELLVTSLYVFFTKIRFNFPINVKAIVFLIIPVLFSLVKIIDFKFEWSVYKSTVYFIIFIFISIVIFYKHFYQILKLLKKNAF